MPKIISIHTLPETASTCRTQYALLDDGRIISRQWQAGISMWADWRDITGDLSNLNQEHA